MLLTARFKYLNSFNLETFSAQTMPPWKRNENLKCGSQGISAFTYLAYLVVLKVENFQVATKLVQVFNLLNVILM
jgi:hypothetical protein